MASFRNSTPGLWAPKFVNYEANSPKVSGRYREYSRFSETDGGDRVRSALVGRAGIVIRRVLLTTARKLGIPRSHCRAEFAVCSGSSPPDQLAKILDRSPERAKNVNLMRPWRLIRLVEPPRGQHHGSQPKL